MGPLLLIATVALLVAPSQERAVLSAEGSGDDSVVLKKAKPQKFDSEHEFSGDFTSSGDSRGYVDDEDEGSGRGDVRNNLGSRSFPTTVVAAVSTVGVTKGSSPNTAGAKDPALPPKSNHDHFIDIDDVVVDGGKTLAGKTSAVATSSRHSVHLHSSVVPVHTSPAARQQAQTATQINNELPLPTGRAVVDEDSEEETNAIGNAGYAVAQESRLGFKAEHSGLHPGLLAAVIGGGVVGLLCAILLVMFVVYRLRKKDEGGYSTVDCKPRLNTYTKASSREFYA